MLQSTNNIVDAFMVSLGPVVTQLMTSRGPGDARDVVNGLIEQQSSSAGPDNSPASNTVDPFDGLVSSFEIFIAAFVDLAVRASLVLVKALSVKCMRRIEGQIHEPTVGDSWVEAGWKASL